MTLVGSLGNENAIQLSTLPTDEVRQVMWRFGGREDLQQLIRSARSVSRGPVARLVADGQRNGWE